MALAALADAADAAAALRVSRKGPLVLLFYDGFDQHAIDRPGGALRSWAHATSRYAYRRARGAQLYTGFYVAFRAYVAGLEAIGCDVRINDFALARSMPDYPIGVGGFPSAVDAVAALPNPKIWGPGDCGPHERFSDLIARHNFKLFTQPSPWAKEALQPFAQGRMRDCFAGIDMVRWPDWSAEPKTNDVLIYDKLYWDRDQHIQSVLTPLISHLDQSGLSHQVIRYSKYSYAEFRRSLQRSRVFVFLSRHESQGLACNEAMAANLPVFAWDEGVLADPNMPPLPADANVTSVPYFDSRCGMRFKLDEMLPAFDAFWSTRERFKPRTFVEQKLALPHSGRRYLSLYASLCTS